MNVRTKQAATVLFGLIVAAAGVWRHVESGGNPKALWFGVVMGGLAVLGALLLFLKRRVPGYVLMVLSLAFVGGWFLHRTISGHEEGLSARIVLILAACAAETVVLLLKSRSE
jgi:hypothetical protein